MAGPCSDPIQQQKTADKKWKDSVKRVTHGMRLPIDHPEHLRTKQQRHCDDRDARQRYWPVKPAPAFEPNSFHACFFIVRRFESSRRTRKSRATESSRQPAPGSAEGCAFV